ncbi:MAG: hypothetical protein Q7S27_04870 [Nanoarchaeota archaeon]|nr:hypothetical protein [Nanoarchaeota archaeon]
MRYDGIEIIGSGKFSEKTVDALEWIKSKSKKDYEKVRKYLKVIKQSSRSLMLLKTAQFNVNIRSAYHGVEWYAGIIVHDVHHYYLHAIKGFKWEPKTFAKHEYLCFDEQLKFLRKIKAPQWLIDHVEKSYKAGHWRPSARKKQNW